MMFDSINILLLEDNQDDAELIKIEIEKADFDYTLIHVDDEGSFLEAIDKSPPDIVLSDYNIPGYDIFLAKEALASKNIHVPFIVVTGALGDERAVDLIVNHGISDYILKDNLTRLNTAILREVNNIKVQKELYDNKIELEKLSLVASHTHNGVIITDNEGLIEWVNKGFETITGFTLKESVGKKPGDILQGANTDDNVKKEISRKLEAETSFSKEILNYKKTGEPYWIKLDITPVFDNNGQLTQFIAIQEDITERKIAESELLDSYKQLKRSQKIGKIGSWAYYKGENEFEWSDEMYNIYERRKDLGPPTFEEVMDMADRDDPYNTIKDINNALLKGESFDRTVKLEIEPEKFIQIYGQSIYDSDGFVVGIEGVVRDVSNLMKKENELRSANRQLLEIANNIDGVLMQYKLKNNREDELIYISEGCEQIFGVSQKQALKDNTIIWDGVHKDDRNGLNKAIEKSAVTQSLYAYSWRHYHPDGTLRYLQARGTPTPMGDDSTVWNTVILDVTDQKMAELQEKELQQLLKATLNEIYIYDAETLKFVYCNNAAEYNTKYSMEELENLTPLDLKRDLKKEEFLNLLKQADKEGVNFFETTHFRKDDSKYNIVAKINSETYNGRKVYVANILDITEKIWAEESYKETNHKLRQLIDAAPIGVYLIDTEGIVIDFWNPAAEQIFGFKKEEVLGGFIPAVSEKHLEEYSELMELIKKGEALSGKRVIREHKSGKEIIVELNTGPIYKNGELFEVLILVQDVTDLVQKEVDLKVALKDKDVLIQEVHHRVKNNLAIVSGILELQIMRGDAHPQLVDTKNRILSIAAVHEKLYRTDSFSEIETEPYLEPLIRKSKESFIGHDQDIKVRLITNIDKLNINEAIPLGMLINELITNSVRHAFDHNDGTIEISLAQSGPDHILFNYSDSGKGFDRSKFENNEGFGLELIRTLISQLSNDFKLNTNEKFELEFRFQRKNRGSYSNM